MKDYKHPLYYEIAFSFRNIKKEVDFFEQCIKKFSKIKVRNILEIGCGNSPYLFELNKRDYRFTGLDLSKEMLKYTKKKAKERGIKINTLLANMVKFRTRKKYDFAFVMLGSVYVNSNKDFLLHLDSVSNCLRKGGLYLIDASIAFNLPCNKEEWAVHLKNRKLYLIYKNKTSKLPTPKHAKWLTEKNNIKVKVNVDYKIINKVNQIRRQTITLNINEDKKKKKIVIEDSIGKYIFPQEFLELVKVNGKFEFIGWFNNFNLKKPLEKAKTFNRTITILRRN